MLCREARHDRPLGRVASFGVLAVLPAGNLPARWWHSILARHAGMQQGSVHAAMGMVRAASSDEELDIYSAKLAGTDEGLFCFPSLKPQGCLGQEPSRVFGGPA